MKVSRSIKFAVSMLLLLCVLFQLSPLVNAEEQYVPLLENKPIKVGTNQNNILESTTLMTDNDESTYFSFAYVQESTARDTIIYDFDEPVDISAYKMLILNYNNGPISMVFYDSEGNKIGSFERQILKGDNGIYNFPQTYTNVSRVYLGHRGSITYKVAELNLYHITTEQPEPQPEPEPEPEPNPQPQPSGDRAILVVTMTTGLEKEYDLSMSEVNAFINWYDAKDAGSGPSKYAINKHDNNRGPFNKRTDYVIFSNILIFEVNEYTVTSATYN